MIALKMAAGNFLPRCIALFNRISIESLLKDKSGVNKNIVKKQPYQLLNTNREFFPSFDASNFHQFVNESSLSKAKYGRHFVFCVSVRRHDKEASNVSGIISTHLAASFSST